MVLIHKMAYFIPGVVDHLTQKKVRIRMDLGHEFGEVMHHNSAQINNFARRKSNRDIGLVSFMINVFMNASLIPFDLRYLFFSSQYGSRIASATVIGMPGSEHHHTL
jgi:hypothetical protein